MHLILYYISLLLYFLLLFGYRFVETDPRTKILLHLLFLLKTYAFPQQTQKSMRFGAKPCTKLVLQPLTPPPPISPTCFPYRPVNPWCCGSEPWTSTLKSSEPSSQREMRKLSLSFTHIHNFLLFLFLFVFTLLSFVFTFFFASNVCLYHGRELK